jgi:hypothetical protein
VDLVLTGHSHSYERSKFLNGHYGVSSTLTEGNILSSGSGGDEEHPYTKPLTGQVPNKGTVYVVAGNGGQLHEGPLNHPAMAVSLSKLGSMSLAFDAHELVATMVGADGAIEDRFIVRKDPNLPRPVKDVTATLDPSACRVDVKWTKRGIDDSYVVYRSTNPEDRGVAVATVSARHGVYSDLVKELSGNGFTYSVRAKNSSGLGPWGDAVRITLPQGEKCRQK